MVTRLSPFCDPIHSNRSGHTKSMVTKLSPFCGYNMTKCAELVDEDLLRYSTKIESSDLRQCPSDH